MRARRSDAFLDWTKLPEDTKPDRTFGDDVPMSHPGEMERGLVMPVQLYPMFETALRAAAGEGVEDHQAKVSELWARFAAVAVENPFAWSRQPLSAEEIRTPGPDNRMIGFPYPKYMNSNNDVDLASALLMCTAEKAEALGVPRDRWVFPHAGTDCHDHYFVSERDQLGASAGGAHRRPARAGAGRARRRRRRGRRPLLVLPLGGAGRRGRARARHSTASSPAPEGCRSPVDRGTTTWATPSPRSCRTSGPGPARSAWCGATAATSPSTPSASTAPSHRPAGSATTPRRTRSTPCPGGSWPSRPTRRSGGRRGLHRHALAGGLAGDRVRRLPAPRRAARVGHVERRGRRRRAVRGRVGRPPRRS